ncbi:hypothetical protein ACHAXT_007156 [Thalassiosira profunda]
MLMPPRKERAAALALGYSTIAALLVSFILGVVLSNVFRSRSSGAPAAIPAPLLNGAMQQSSPGNACLLSLDGVRNIRLYSQNDEDGALLQALRCMGGHGTKEYFEFGSENGAEVNTRILRELYGWNGHLLDGGYERPEIPLHQEYFTPTSIVQLMKKYKVGKTLDVLSVDCDYDDFWILREILVAGYKPRILITEFNCNFGSEWAVSTLPKPVGNEASAGWTGDCYFGASASALIALARVFGYTPFWSNTVNLMFVRLDQATELGMIIPAVESFPGPYTRALHSDCNTKVWNLIDESNISKALDKKISHEEFASGFEEVKLSSRSYEPDGGGQMWRVFQKAR